MLGSLGPLSIPSTSFMGAMFKFCLKLVYFSPSPQPQPLSWQTNNLLMGLPTSNVCFSRSCWYHMCHLNYSYKIIFKIMTHPYIKYFIRFLLNKNKIQVPNSDSYGSAWSAHLQPLHLHLHSFPLCLWCGHCGHIALLSVPRTDKLFSFCHAVHSLLIAWLVPLSSSGRLLSQRPLLSILPKEASQTIPSHCTYTVIFVTLITVCNYST